MLAVKGEACGALYKARFNRQAGTMVLTLVVQVSSAFVGSTNSASRNNSYFVLSGLLRKDFIGTNRAFLALLCPPLCSGGETDLHRQTAFTLPLDLALLCPPLCSGGETDLHRRTFALPPSHHRVSGWTHSDFHALFLFSNAALIQLFCIRSICLSANIF